MEKIIKQYQFRIYSFILQYVKIPEVAEDMTQEMLIKIWQNEERILSIDDPENYILAMTRNFIRDHFKKMSREEAYMKKVLENMPVADNPILRKINTNELTDRINEVVSGLPDRQKEVFQLIYDQGKTLQETAQELNISPFTVKNHKIQALKFIRSKINPEFFFIFLLTSGILF